VQAVQPLDGGRVAEVLVEEAESVSAGRALLRMDARQSMAQLERYRQRLDLARRQQRRINTARSGEAFERRSGQDAEPFARVHSELESEGSACQRARDGQRAALERARAAARLPHARATANGVWKRLRRSARAVQVESA